MGRAAIAPTGQERTFGVGELIVSKTDVKGHITYANDVFLRLARYESHEVVGEPHNVIRHPEMPRGVFHLLWQALSEGNELFAVINNLASDGAHYWVLAHVTPSHDESGAIVGYHSNRHLPDRPLIDAVRPLYRRMLTEEAQHNRVVDAARAGADLLTRHCAENDMSYDEFIWQLIHSTGNDS